MEVEVRQKKDEVVFSSTEIAESLIVRPIANERGDLAHYELVLMLEDEEIEVWRQVVPTAVGLIRMWAITKLFTAAYEHSFWEYENIAI